MNEQDTEAQRRWDASSFVAAALFLVAYATGIYGLMWLLIVGFGLGDPKFRTPDIYFFTHSIFFAPAALFVALLLLTPGRVFRDRILFGGICLVAIILSDTIVCAVDHWSALLFSYVALITAFLYYRHARNAINVA